MVQMDDSLLRMGQACLTVPWRRRSLQNTRDGRGQKGNGDCTWLPGIRPLCLKAELFFPPLKGIERQTKQFCFEVLGSTWEFCLSTCQ